MRIDAHQHFWNYTRDAADYGWMTDPKMQVDRSPGDLAPLLAAEGFDGCVAVQARARREETDSLLRIADEHAFVKGVVGWLDLTDPDVGAMLDAYADAPRLKGLRMLIHDEPADDFAASPAHVHGVSMLAAHGLTYDLLLRPRHIPAAIALVDRCPDQAFVVDHIAKPDLTLPRDEAWFDGMAELARRPNVMAKLSGLVTEADPANWRAAPYDLYLDRTLDLFGPERLMFGSDWPVSAATAPYDAVHALVADWARRLGEGERAAIFGETARRFYGLG
ncbi:amidohydrolase [Jiella sp. M17.18]|uniref:amidohydrolase family protein n=1 Tax=Jiella sp. M17.18 TaxID=3234247 RepID=UPI0034DF504C